MYINIQYPQEKISGCRGFFDLNLTTTPGIYSIRRLSPGGGKEKC